VQGIGYRVQDIYCILQSTHRIHEKQLPNFIDVKELWWNGVESDADDYNRMIQKAKASGIVVKNFKRGDKLKIKKGVQIKFLSPPKNSAQTIKDNNQSLVFQILSGGWKALFTGDMEMSVEFDLIEKYGDSLKSDYLKVAHHGSRTSSDRSFLEKVKPLIASVGLKEGNRFGHPHPNVIRTYEEEHIPLLRTDELGAIEINFLENEIIVNSFKKGRVLSQSQKFP